MPGRSPLVSPLDDSTIKTGRQARADSTVEQKSCSQILPDSQSFGVSWNRIFIYCSMKWVGLSIVSVKIRRFERRHLLVRDWFSYSHANVWTFWKILGRHTAEMSSFSYQNLVDKPSEIYRQWPPLSIFYLQIWIFFERDLSLIFSQSSDRKECKYGLYCVGVRLLIVQLRVILPSTYCILWSHHLLRRKITRSSSQITTLVAIVVASFAITNTRSQPIVAIIKQCIS